MPAEALRVLLVADRPATAARLQQALDTKSFTTTLVDDWADAAASLGGQSAAPPPFDLAVLALADAAAGLALAADLSALAPTLPLLLLTDEAPPAPPAEALNRLPAQAPERELRQLAAALGRCRRAEAALAQAREQAATAQATQARFLATMSHELRTPLNAILNMNDLLFEGALDPDQREYARVARDSAKALLSIVNGVLDYARLDAGRVAPALLPSDPEQIVQSVLDLLAARARARDNALTIFCDPRLPPRLLTDPGLVRQILLNLIGNAIKFTAGGAVRVRLTAAKEHWSCVVSDTGIGIEPAAMATLFQEFAQADASLSRRFDGTGLGLAISRRLARLLGGDITASSRPGEGSSFSLCLPLGSLPPSADPDARHTAAKALAAWRLELRCRDALVCADLRGQLAAFGLTVDWQPHAGLPGEGPECGELLLSLPGAGAAPVPRRVWLLHAGTPVPRQLPPDVVACLRLPLVPSALLARLVAACAAVGPQPEAEVPAPQRLLQRLTRIAAKLDPILVAEDGQANQLVTTTLLGQAGLRVELAENGLQAVAAVNRQRYALVLMDLTMPEMDGLEATGCIRALPGKRGRLPIIAMTASVSPQDRERCLAAGMDDFLVKPIEREALYSTLLRWLTMPDPPDWSAPASAADGTTAPAATAPLDLSVLEKLEQDLSPELVPSVVALFLEEGRAHIATILTAVAAGDCAIVAREAHTLKGGAGTFGATRLRERAWALEQAARAGDLEAVRAQAPVLAQDGTAVLAALVTRYGLPPTA